MASAGAPEMPDSLKRSLENSKAEYVRLGRSGLKVSVPILGAMSFGSAEWMDWVLEEDKVRFPTREMMVILRWWGGSLRADIAYTIAGVAAAEGGV